jgi:hypothetical protein
MANILAAGHDVPLKVPIGEEGFVRVPAHLLHIRFGFCESSIMLEEEVLANYGVIKEAILQSKCSDKEGFYWLLHPGQYRAYGLAPETVAASTEILAPMSDGSTVQLPLSRADSHQSSDQGRSVTNIMMKLRNVKQEPVEPLIDLTSESDGDTRSTSRACQHPSKLVSFPSSSNTPSGTRTPANTPTSSSWSLPPVFPVSSECLSVMQCLRKLSSVPRCRNELAQIDFDAVEYHKVKFLPTKFDGNVVFELPPCRGSANSSMEGMDKRYDGHAWCRTLTSNIHNNLGLKFKRSSCVGHLVCKNKDCDYFARTSKVNETEWYGTTTLPFGVCQDPPADSSLVCKVCKKPPTCIDFCAARIYYVVSAGDMSRACIHLGNHKHPVAEGQCRETMETVTELIAQEVAKTPSAKNSAIALAASKEFLETFLIHNGDGPKEMLREEALEKVMDKFQLLSSPSVRNIIATYRDKLKGAGEIDRILTMKSHAKIEFIHDSVFPGQGKDKVYLFKMLVDGPGSGVDLVRRMQPEGDLEHCFVMFDHVKRVKSWTTLACHVYDSKYCKVMTIAVCDMQTEGTEGQMIFWNCLNNVMKDNGVPNPDFKGFMCDSAQANFNAVRTVYGSGDPKVPMVDRERTCLFHWATSMHKHTEKHIAKAFQAQHIRLCRQYKDATTMAEADQMYLQLKAWWYSSGAADEDSIRELEDWLAFWHFRYRQWGGFMETVRLMLNSHFICTYVSLFYI